MLFTMMRTAVGRLRSAGMRVFHTTMCPKEVRMKLRRYTPLAFVVLSLLAVKSAISLPAQMVTYLPYIQPGDNGPFGPKDQMIVTWQTNESSPVTSAYSVQFGKSLNTLQTVPLHALHARVVDNYLASDPQFSALVLPFAYGAHSNYTAVLQGLEYDTTYQYVVTGPGLPASGFTSSFHTRTTSG